MVGWLRPWDGTIKDAGNVLDGQGQLYTLRGPVKNENAGLLLKKVLIISRW